MPTLDDLRADDWDTIQQGKPITGEEMRTAIKAVNESSPRYTLKVKYCVIGTAHGSYHGVIAHWRTVLGQLCIKDEYGIARIPRGRWSFVVKPKKLCRH